MKGKSAPFYFKWPHGDATFKLNGDSKTHKTYTLAIIVTKNVLVTVKTVFNWKSATPPPPPPLPLLKGATSEVAGGPAVLDRTVIVLDRTVIVLDRTVIVLNRIVIVLDRSVIAIYVILSLNFLQLGCGSDRLWLLRTARHTSAPALPTLSILSGDRYVNKTLPRAGLFPGARSCAFNLVRDLKESVGLDSCSCPCMPPQFTYKPWKAARGSMGVPRGTIVLFDNRSLSCDITVSDLPSPPSLCPPHFYPPTPLPSPLSSIPCSASLAQVD